MCVCLLFCVSVSGVRVVCSFVFKKLRCVLFIAVYYCCVLVCFSLFFYLDGFVLFGCEFIKLICVCLVCYVARAVVRFFLLCVFVVCFMCLVCLLVLSSLSCVFVFVCVCVGSS